MHLQQVTTWVWHACAGMNRPACKAGTAAYKKGGPGPEKGLLAQGYSPSMDEALQDAGAEPVSWTQVSCQRHKVPWRNVREAFASNHRTKE